MTTKKVVNLSEEKYLRMSEDELLAHVIDQLVEQVSQLALLNSVQNNQFWKAVSTRNKIDLGHDVYAKSTATAASSPTIKLES